jgi:hypothetical protein
MQYAWEIREIYTKVESQGLKERDRLGNPAVGGRSCSDSHKSSVVFHGVDTKYEHLFWNTAVK